RRLHQAGHGRDHVIHRAAPTSLRARAVHGERVDRTGLVHDPGNDHAVAPRLARADHVEEPCDDARYAGLGPVYVGDQLVEPLGGRVRPSTLGRSTVDAVVVLLEPVGVVLAVDLAGRGDQVRNTVTDRRLDHVLRTVQVDPQRPQRVVDDVVDTHRRREVVDDVGLADQAVDQLPVQDVSPDETKTGFG